MKTLRNHLPSIVLLTGVIGVGVALALYKMSSIKQAQAASSNQPEPVEMVTTATAQSRAWQPSATSIGTVLATRSITLRNEVAGTVRHVRLNPGDIVKAGTVLVELDVSVEQADLQAAEAQVALAKTALQRVQRLHQDRAAPQSELDRAQAEHDVAAAQIARIKAVIAKKTILAPFTARVGLSDVHQGQYLNEGTTLTTLQGVDDAVNIDFAVAQIVAAGLRPGMTVQLYANERTPLTARIVAIDALIDAVTRNAKVRAQLTHATHAIAPGSSVRVVVPAGVREQAVAIPVSALRKGPEGDHVFVILPGKDGKSRAQRRAVVSGNVLGDTMLIHSGLDAGETVAATGSFKLRDGVLVVPAATTASK
jgi:membrane fusion protein, multidrug efflux system